MSDYDLIVRGGQVFYQGELRPVDVLVKDGKVAAIEPDSVAEAAKTLDAEGKIVLPGIIDPHVHMQIKQQDKYPTADDFTTGTRSAAAGGVTTIIDFFESDEEGGTLMEAYRARRELADPQVMIDYALHCNPPAEADLGAEIEALIEAGVTSFKLFQVYGRLALSDAQLYEDLEVIARQGALAMLHAENGQVVDLLVDRIKAAGGIAPIEHARSRPPFVEAACIATAAAFTQAVDGQLYIVHLSTADGLRQVEMAQAAGARILAETCTHYLMLDESSLEGEQGMLFMCAPPLRKPHHQAALWDGLADGHIQTGATDHCSFNRGQKLEAPSFYQAPGGLGTVELLLPILYSQGVAAGRFDLARLVEILCENTADIFGLSPRKGRIQPGADADLVIFDPQAEWVVHSDQLHSASDYNVYEGLKLRGQVQTTVARGQVVYHQGEVHADPGRGMFLPCRIPDRADLERIIPARS
ncbi:MAG: dihydropyrimidinase [Anaerolineales bacterium]|jgi:dihydropyrimidinase